VETAGLAFFQLEIDRGQGRALTAVIGTDGMLTAEYLGKMAVFGVIGQVGDGHGG